MGVGVVINACCNLIDHIIQVMNEIWKTYHHGDELTSLKKLERKSQSEETATSVKRPFTVKVCKYVHLFVCLFSKMCSFHELCVFVIFSRKTGF